MSLNLDARQRAMLQEMGVTVWTRAETAAPQSPAAPAMAQPISTPAARAHTAPAPAAPAAPMGLGAPGAAPALRLHAPQLLYPTADPAQTPPGLGAGWLIVTEGIAAADPLGGDAGKLLDNMLRAMLQEMGVTVWTRAETTAPLAPAAMQPVTVAVPATAPLPAAPAIAQPPAMPVAQPSPAPAARAPAAPAPAAPAAPAGLGAPGAAPALRLHAPQLLYPTADPAQTPPGLGAGWLIVTEGIAAADPLGGDAGKLLDNMLRAMQLHRHPRVFVAALERPAPGARTAEGAAAPADVAAALAEVVTTLQPALVLVLGHVAARAALGRTEPLGRLRAVPHTVAGRPAVVTYDPAFLLRSQDAKAATWADLCRALALVRKAEGGASHAG